MDKHADIYYRGSEVVLVNKALDGFAPGSSIFVDVDLNGQFEYQAQVATDGIASLSFPLESSAQIALYWCSADGQKHSEISTLNLVKVSSDNSAKAIPVNLAVDVNQNILEANICTCIACPENTTLFGGSLEGFTNSYTPTEHNVEIATGKYRKSIPVTAFDTRILGFDFKLHHVSMVEYDGPMGQSFSHSLNMMIAQTDELNGIVVTPDLRIFHIYSVDGVNWCLPDGFYTRLYLDQQTHRWEMTHFSGLNISFYQAMLGCPGYPVSITEPNGNTLCMTYDASGNLQDVTTDLGQIQRFQYDSSGRLSAFTDHIERTWQFPHDAEGRLTGIITPSTTYANISAGTEITDVDLEELMINQQRCWSFGYQDSRFPNQVTSETDPRGAVYRENQFDHRGRVNVARINSNDVLIDYELSGYPLNVAPLEPGNMLRKVTDREGNIRYQEIHGIDGGPKQNAGKLGLRRSMTMTERGKGNLPLREDEPEFWEQRWVYECDCLVPLVVTEPFSSENIATLQFDDFNIPLNSPRQMFTYNEFHQKTAWTYTDGTETINVHWTYQKYSFGDHQQFSRLLSETDPREFDHNNLYAGLYLLHNYQYDGFGNRIQHDAPTVTRGTRLPQKISEFWTYNEFGQVICNKDANGNLLNYAYFDGVSSGGDINSKGRFGGYLKSILRGGDGSTDPVTKLKRRFNVNALGMNTCDIDENGFRYITEYNNLQEITRVLNPKVTLINSERVRYESQFIQDGAGNTVLERRSNIDFNGSAAANSWIDKSTRFDAVNNVLSVREETDKYAANDITERYSYDNNDDQIVRLKPQGNRTFTLYDERRLPFKTFYGVALIATTDNSAVSGNLRFDYPVDKRANALADSAFVGLSINTYDARKNLTHRQDGRGNLDNCFFDFYNRQIAYSDANGNGWQRVFDDASNILTESQGAISKKTGQMTKLLTRKYYRFDELGRQYQEVHDVNVASCQYQDLNPDNGENSSFLTYHDPASRVTAFTDANGNMTHSEYDAANRVICVIDAQGNQQASVYDANSNVLSVMETEVPGAGASGVRETYNTRFTYDQLNRLTEQHILGLNGNSIDHDSLFFYDSRDNLRLEKDEQGNFVMTSFDHKDRKIMMQHFDANPLKYKASELLHYEWRYDKNANIVELHAVPDLTMPGCIQITRYQFDDLDRNVQIIYPDSAVDGPDKTVDRVVFEYDSNNNPIKVTDQRGVVFDTVFDRGNRLIEQSLRPSKGVPGTQKQVFEYDPINRMTAASNDYAKVDFTFDSLSRISAETQSIRLDGSGFETGWEQPVRIDRDFDKQSNTTTNKVRNCASLDLSIVSRFDSLNRVTDISANYFELKMHKIASYAYLGPTRITHKRLGNGAELTCTYDTKRRLRTHHWKSAKQFLLGFEYDYDRVDNVLFERFVHERGLCDHFQYNNKYEHTGVDYRLLGSVPPSDPANTFEYDDLFNRRKAQFTSPIDSSEAIQDSYQVNKANENIQLTRNDKLVTLGYDKAGNATDFPVRLGDSSVGEHLTKAQARWDGYNLLFDIKLSTDGPAHHYRYDPFRRRIAALTLENDNILSGSRRYIYDGWDVIEERLFDAGTNIGSTSSTLERIYVNGRQMDEPLLAAIDRNKDGKLGQDNGKNKQGSNSDCEYYFLNNRLGSVMALLDADNEERILESYRYSIFGQPQILAGNDPVQCRNQPSTGSLLAQIGFDQLSEKSQFDNNYLFTARRFDPDTGLYYYRNRYYEWSMGRFISRDPNSYVDGLNLYTYVHNNPVSFKDPTGEAAVSATILAIIGAILAAGAIVAAYKFWLAYKEALAIEKRLEALSKLSRGLCPTSESFIAIKKEQAILRVRLLELGSDAAKAAAETGVSTPGLQGLPGPAFGPKPGRM